jgi:crotonobetainyl-CoA:carnitine CoA-transferase CaiB-like acyl-CoA transferase
LFVADHLGGMAALAAIETALLRRQRTGAGQMIDLALLDPMLGRMSFEVQAAQFTVREPTMQYAPTRARDGHVIAMPITQSNFEALADATGHPHWKTDARFADFGARKAHWEELMELLGVWAADRTAEECERVITAAGCPCSCYRTVAEAMDSAQSRHRDVTAVAEDAAGAFLVTRPPWRMSAAPAPEWARVPTLGQHGARRPRARARPRAGGGRRSRPARRFRRPGSPGGSVNAVQPGRCAIDTATRHPHRGRASPFPAFAARPADRATRRPT